MIAVWRVLMLSHVQVKRNLQIVLCALKPVVCKEYKSQFADNKTLSHQKSRHTTSTRSITICPSDMTLPTLKQALKSTGLSVSGNKATLVRRLERTLAGES